MAALIVLGSTLAYDDPRDATSYYHAGASILIQAGYTDQPYCATLPQQHIACVVGDAPRGVGARARRRGVRPGAEDVGGGGAVEGREPSAAGAGADAFAVGAPSSPSSPEPTNLRAHDQSCAVHGESGFDGSESRELARLAPTTRLGAPATSDLEERREAPRTL